MNKKILFYHHLGFGDHIVHNGMIRYFHEKLRDDEKLYIFSKKHNLKNVTFMFRDLDRLNIIPVKDDDEANVIYQNFDGFTMNNMLNGFEYLTYNELCDDFFYLKMNLSPEIKKTYFHIPRDLQREQKCFDNLVTCDEYIFLHEDEMRNFKIERNRLNNLPIVCADENYDFFDFLKIIENAKEVHLISSSFLSLMTCKKFNNSTYAHMYVRYKELSKFIKKNDIIVYE